MTTSSHHPRILVVGGAGGLGQRVVALLEASTEGGVVRIDDARQVGDGLASETRVLVDLGRWACPTPADDSLADARRLVDAAAGGHVEHVVVVSSAAVYGAWPDNPVPLCEDAVLRPNPGGGYALAKAESERRWGMWAAGRADAKLAVLRPALVVGDEEQWLAVALRAVTRWGVGEPNVPTQFVHVDDLAGAVALAVERSLDGVYNVAPEGWLEGREVQSLAGTPIRPPVPPALASALARWCWSRGLGGVAPEWVPYATHPWVVAGDRLRAEGWAPEYTGPETLLDSYPLTPWARLGPKGRRMVTLATGAAAGLGVPLAALALAVVRRRCRRR
ncbi:MAG: NAD-dependent epimerase/dehydratase family protein [Actinomycetota bacterium]|nr:NAD-dependent epimerase/dehydratase family protein [Actinomycetota bacterium]